MLTQTKYKCLSCGQKFVDFDGGIVLRPHSVVCPKCGSKLCIIWLL